MLAGKKDDERESRIDDEVVVDAYDAEERAMSWYYYLADNLSFPFKARCVATRPISPLVEGEEVQVRGMAPLEECSREMFVEISWRDRGFAVPLSQLEALGVVGGTREAVEDWHYWVGMGHEM